MRRCPFNERYFRQITTESQAYWLGFIAADGCVTGGSLQINLAGKDAAHLKALSDAIELNRSPRMGTSNFNTSVARFAVTNEALVSDLMSLGIVPRKSACLKPWSGPPDLMRPYWRGLFDGDGCITSGSNGTGRRYWRVSMNGTEDIVRGLVAASLLPCPVRPHASICDRCGWAPLSRVLSSGTYTTTLAFICHASSRCMSECAASFIRSNKVCRR